MGGRRKEAVMTMIPVTKKNGNPHPSGSAPSSRKAIESKEGQHYSRRSFWSRDKHAYRKSSEDGNIHGCDSLSPLQQPWWEGLVSPDEESAQTSSASGSGSESTPRVDVDHHDHTDDEGPSDEESRPSTLFLRRRSHHSRWRRHSLGTAQTSPLRVVSLSKNHHRGHRSSSSSRRVTTGHNTNSKNRHFQESKSHHSKGNSGGRGDGRAVGGLGSAAFAPAPATTLPLQSSKGGGTREQRRRELIAHYLYAEAGSQGQSNTAPTTNSNNSLNPTHSLYAQGPWQRNYVHHHHHHLDRMKDGDDRIVDHALFYDMEADGVARRRSCFPSFTRSKFFASSAPTTATTITGGTITTSSTNGVPPPETSASLQEDEEEAYDYDYYFTIGNSNTLSTLNNSETKNTNHKYPNGVDYEIHHPPTLPGTCHWPRTENMPNNNTRTFSQRRMSCTGYHPSLHVQSQSPHSTHYTKASPTAARRTVRTVDHPDAYCFFPVDDHSNLDDDNADDDNDDYGSRYHNDNDDSQYNPHDLPICNLNDIRFYSSICATHVASLEMTKNLQARCQSHDHGGQHVHQYYLEMTEPTRNECTDIRISPREALEGLVPQDLLSLLLETCHLEPGGSKETNNKSSNKGNDAKATHMAKCHHPGVASDKEWTARATDPARSLGEFNY